MTIFIVVIIRDKGMQFSQYCIFLSSTTSSFSRSARFCIDWCHGSSKNENVKLREKLRLVTWRNGGKREGLQGPLKGRSRCFTWTLCWLSGLASLIACGGFVKVSDDMMGGGGRGEGGEGRGGGRGGGGGMLVKEDSELEEPSHGAMKLFWKAVEMRGWACFIFPAWVVIFSEGKTI